MTSAAIFRQDLAPFVFAVDGKLSVTTAHPAVKLNVLGVVYTDDRGEEVLITGSARPVQVADVPVITYLIGLGVQSAAPVA